MDSQNMSEVDSTTDCKNREL